MTQINQISRKPNQINSNLRFLFPNQLKSDFEFELIYLFASLAIVTLKNILTRLPPPIQDPAFV